MQCCVGASWGLVWRVLSQALVSTGRDTQRPPPDSIFPPQRWALKSRLTAIHAQNTWAKAEGGGHYLGVAGKSALVRWIYDALAWGNSSALFPPFCSAFSLPLWYCVEVSERWPHKVSLCCGFICAHLSGPSSVVVECGSWHRRAASHKCSYSADQSWFLMINHTAR